MFWRSLWATLKGGQKSSAEEPANHHDAVCFTAGVRGLAFGAGAIHAHLASDRPTPAVVAGVSLGALNAAAMQRSYRDLNKAKQQLNLDADGTNRQAKCEAARWQWLRKYVTAIAYAPLGVIWDAIPDPSDFFSRDQVPVTDLSTPKRLQEQEREAQGRRLLLEKLLEWLGHIPLKVSDLTEIVVRYIRLREDYPKGARRVNTLAFGKACLRCFWSTITQAVWRPYADYYDFSNARKEWIRRPLFGTRAYILAICALLVVLFAALVVLSLAALASGAAWLVLAKVHFNFIPAVLSVTLIFGFVTKACYEGFLYGITSRFLRKKTSKDPSILSKLFTKLAPQIPSKLGLGESLLNDFYLRHRLSLLFDEKGEKTRVTMDPMPIVIAAAPLQTIFDENGKALPPTQLSATEEHPDVVDALCTAMAIPGLFPPTSLSNPPTSMSKGEVSWWLTPGEGRKIPAKLDMVDGHVVRHNPLPALLHFLKHNKNVAKKLERSDFRPSIHMVYSVPLPDPSACNLTIDESKTNIVDVGLASWRIAKRRDTQMEVEQLEAISRMEDEIVKAQGEENSVVRFHADEIAPEKESGYRNPINPDHEEILTEVATGCRRTLEVVYKRVLAGRGEVECLDLLKEVAPRRKPTTCGLEEVCRYCTKRLRSSDKHPRVKSQIPPSVQWLAAVPGPRIVFVASGGVFRGAFHIGMIAALWDSHIRPDLVVGASVGTLMGGALAALHCEQEEEGLERLAKLIETFHYADSEVALTRTLKDAAREFGQRSKKINLSPADIHWMIQAGTRSDPGFAATGAPPALIDAISECFGIPHRQTATIAASFLAGSITTATNNFLRQVKKRTLPQLKIQYALIGTALLEPLARSLLLPKHLTDSSHLYYKVGIDSAQPYHKIAFFGTTTNLGGEAPKLLLKDYSEYHRVYDPVEAALASCAFPVLFASRRESEIFPGTGRTDVRFADGGMFDNLPFLHAIEVLREVQLADLQERDFLEKLEKRYDNPDLFIAGALNARPELQSQPDRYDSLTAVTKRASQLGDNVKIRSFQASSSILDSQLARLRAAWTKKINNRRSRGWMGPVRPDFITGFVNAAVLPVFPADSEHLNGTYQFCQTLNLDRTRVLRSIADGCYQTLHALSQARTGNGVVQRSIKALGDRVPVVSRGKSEELRNCPFFKRNGNNFVCPFVKTASRYQPSQMIYQECTRDRQHIEALSKAPEVPDKRSEEKRKAA